MKKSNGYDLTTNLPMGAILHDGMGAFTADLCDMVNNILEPGQKLAPLKGVKPEDVEKVFRMDQIRQAMNEPVLALSAEDLSTHMYLFGETGAGMTSAANFRSPKQRSKYTRKKGRRS